MILGSEWEDFRYSDQMSSNSEDKLRNEVRRPNGPAELFSLYSNWGETRVYVRRDGATLDIQSDSGKHRIRPLSDDELHTLTDFITSRKIDDLPEIDMPVVDGAHYFYVHLARSGGRRMHMGNPGEYGTANTVYFHLIKLFERMENHGKFQTHYTFQDTHPGARVLWSSNPAQHIRALWKQDSDFRVYVVPPDDSTWENTDPFSGVWHAFRNGKLAEIVAPPPGAVLYIEKHDDIPDMQIWKRVASFTGGAE